MLIRRLTIAGLRDERGQSLVLALLVMTFLAVSLGTVMFFTAGNQRNANYQKAAQRATSLAEAGVNNAVSVLSNPSNACCIETSPGASGAVLPGSFATASSTTLNGTNVYWWGTLDKNAPWGADASGNKVWTVYGQASIPNPTGPSGSAIVKRVSAYVHVNAPPSTSFNVGVWNTVYSPFGPTTGCDTSIGQGINIAVPVYVGGNLCMGQNAIITKPVYVGGYLFFNNKQGSIGSSTATINSAHVGGYCQVQTTGGQVSPCQSEPVSGPNKTNIWVTGAPSTLAGPASDFAGITAPKICWSGSAAEVLSGACTNQPPGGWYTFAAPGPYNPCPTQTASTPVFDQMTNGAPDGVMNGNAPNQPFNLTPTTAYTCKITGQGELSWDPGNRTLTVAGTIFFDGAVTMTTSGNQPILYTGWGHSGQCTAPADCQSVIYASGDISINSEKLCAVINTAGNDCDWNNWDPNKKLLIFASNGTTGVTVGPSQTSFQGGLYATNTVATGQSAVTEGPLVSGTKTVVLGQQFGGTFPPITIAPWSIQKQPGGFWIDPPTNFCYGTGCPAS
jgi:Tfp pilus assembly protein PilX